MAEKYGLPYDGTAEGFRQVMRGITQAILEGIAGLGVGEQETQDIIQDGGTYVVALNTDQVLGWTSEVLEGFGEEDFSLIEEQSLLANKRNEVMHWPISRLVADLTSLYADPDVHTMPVLGGQTIRDDTLAGRIFHGFYQNAFSMPREQLRTLALEAERLMGVNAYAIMARSRSHDPYTFRRALVNVFSSAGYGHILNADVLTPGALAGVHVTREKYVFSNSQSAIHVHFDLQQQPGSQVDVNQLYAYGTATLLDMNGNQMGDIPNLRFTPDQTSMFVSIPIQSLLFAAGGGSLLGDPFQIKINLFRSDGTRIEGKDRTRGFQVERINESLPENVINILSGETIPDYKIDNGQRHMGADLALINGRAAKEGDAVFMPVVPNASVTILSVGSVGGYGTMATKLLLNFRSPIVLKTELDMHTLLQDINFLSENFPAQQFAGKPMPALLMLQKDGQKLEVVRQKVREYNIASEVEKNQYAQIIADMIGLKTEITVSNIVLFAGHLRPTKEVIWNEYRSERFELGKDNLTYRVNDHLGSSTLIGYLEKGDLDWPVDTPGRDYAGNSYGPHVHVGAYSIEALSQFDPRLQTASVWAGTAYSWDAMREIFVRPESILSR